MKKLTLLGIVVGGAVLCVAPFSIQPSPRGMVELSVNKAEAQYYRRHYRRCTAGHIGEHITAGTAPMDIRPTPTGIRTPTATGIDLTWGWASALALAGGGGDTKQRAYLSRPRRA
jgi:hypothetical protein